MSLSCPKGYNNVMQNLFLSFFLLAFPSFSSFASQSSDAFIIKAYDHYLQVVSPLKFKKGLNVIIENKTIVPLIGQLQTLKGRRLKNFQLAEKGFISIKLTTLKNHERIFFIPLSPPGQEVELILGKKSYEIPPQG